LDKNSISDWLTLLFSFEDGFEEEGGEGDEGAEEDEGGTFEGPFSFFHGEVEEDEEDGENDSVDHAGDADGGVVSENAFFVDREVEEDDEGEAIEKGEGAEEAEGILEHSLRGALLGEHEFVAFGVIAKGEVDEAIFFFGFADEVAAVGFDEVDALADVIALEAEAGPGAFSFTAAVDAEGGSAEGEFTPDFHFEGEFCAEGFLVEFNGAEMVGSPEGVFHFLNLHG